MIFHQMDVKSLVQLVHKTGWCWGYVLEVGTAPKEEDKE
jgi:hypothetical protein